MQCLTVYNQAVRMPENSNQELKKSPTLKQPERQNGMLSHRSVKQDTNNRNVYGKPKNAVHTKPVFSPEDITINSPEFNPPSGLNPLTRVVKTFSLSFINMYKSNSPQIDRSELVEKTHQWTLGILKVASMIGMGIVSLPALFLAVAILSIGVGFTSEISALFFAEFFLQIQAIFLAVPLLYMAAQVLIITPLAHFVAAIVDTYEKTASIKKTPAERFTKKYQRMERLLKQRLKHEQRPQKIRNAVNCRPSPNKATATPKLRQTQLTPSTREILKWLKRAEKQMKLLNIETEKSARASSNKPASPGSILA